MHVFEKIDCLHGGQIDYTFEIYLDDQCLEEHLTLPSGDTVRFTHEGIFSEKGVWFEDDVDFMTRNNDFSISFIDSYNFITPSDITASRTEKTTLTYYVVTI